MTDVDALDRAEIRHVNDELLAVRAPAAREAPGRSWRRCDSPSTKFGMTRMSQICPSSRCVVALRLSDTAVTPSDCWIENPMISEYERSRAEQRDVRAVQRGDDLRHGPAVRCRQNLAGEIRRRRVRHGVVRVDDVEMLVARHLDDLVRQRQQVLRLAEQRIGRRLDAVERQAGLVVAQAERRVRCSARARGGRGRRASCPARWRRCRCLRSRRNRRCRCSRCFQQRWALDRFAHDDALGPRDAGERAELRVAALDELPEQRRVQARGGRAAASPGGGTG